MIEHLPFYVPKEAALGWDGAETLTRKRVQELSITYAGRLEPFTLEEINELYLDGVGD